VTLRWQTFFGFLYMGCTLAPLIIIIIIRGFEALCCYGMRLIRKGKERKDI